MHASARRSWARRPLTVALVLAWTATAQAETQLKEVVVSATRTETEADNVAASITSHTRAELDRRVIADEVDLFRDDPDVAFARDARRFGATRPNIRGLENNRVLQMVDGVRLPDFYNGGGPTNTTMSAPLGVSTDFLKRVEVLRGPASSLYGSDAMGGVLGFLTLDTGDILDRDDRLGLLAKLAHSGVDDSLGGTVLGAGRGDNGLEWVLGYSHKQGHEFDNRGDVDTVSSSRTRPNPQDVTDRGVLAKVALRPAAGHTLRLALEGRDQDADVVVKRLSASLPKVTAMDGDDHTRRLRGSLEWQHQAAGTWYDRLTARLHHQESETANYNRQTRSNTSASCSAAAGAGNNCYVEQDFFFDQTSLGGGLQAEKTIGRHFLTLGLDLARVETEEMRDARVWNLTTGGIPGVTAPGKSLAGDTFPLRDFALGYTESIGFFLQDDIALAEDKLTLTPGLRYDWRKLKPEPDALSQAVLTAIGKQVAEQSDGAFSPKLAALWRFSPEWSAFGHVAGGFRAPNYEEVNGHFRNTAQSYGVAPNPDLEPETSVGVELGLRLNRPGLRGQFTVYDNRYRDFIESVRLTCPADPECIGGLAVTYQSRNLSKVRIHGAELRGAWDFRPGWSLNGALAYAHGDNEEAGQPLNSIEPTRLSLALTRDAGTWGAEGRLRAAGRKNRVDDSDGVWFRVPAYGVTDLSFWWKPARQARLTVALNNVFDKKYWLWSDIRQADATSPVGVDFYSQPGRSLAASFEYTF